ncbi:MAG: glutamate-5-semialdehyde dehydrogenase [Solirubrobacterales bacterium]|nr:glutamate-5-semialdehyde dehydrogenase [Solirubrobacterales bacterium]
MATAQKTVTDICAEAKTASRELSLLDPETKNRALNAIADALDAKADQIVAANAKDLEAGRENNLEAALMDRLMLDHDRLASIANDVRKIATLEDPVGRLIREFKLYNGLDVRKIAVPLGVIAVVYEARPNVTIDAAALCLKSGNAIVLRGSSIATNSNAVLAQVARDAVASAGVPEAAISIVNGGDRDELRDLATQEGVIDLIIPRGGEGLKHALKSVATVPVIYAAAGNNHVYIDASANLDWAEEIVVNAKVQRPGVCNAAETLLVHEDVAKEFLPRILKRLEAEGVELRADAQARALAGVESGEIAAAQAADWDTEYLALILAVRVVDSVEAAIEHVNLHGTGHSEAIVTDSNTAAHKFTSQIDAACVYVNASTRFTDGGEFGLGAEIGNSTQKLHARGPIALRELCSYKYVVEGDGQVRS